MFKRLRTGTTSSFIAVLVLSAMLLVPAPNLAAAEVQQLKIEVVGGESALNNVKTRLGRNVEVRILDQNDQPVAGAVVVFQPPMTGAGAVFADGKTMFMATTGANGHAITVGLRPNAIEGRFSIAVRATYQTIEARTTVVQTNTLAGGEVGKTSSHKKYWILGLVGVAAAGGVLVATHGGSSSSSTPSGSTVSLGTIAIGGPR